MPDIFHQLADFLVYSDGGLSPETAWGQAVHFFIMDITKIFFMLVVLLFLVGLLRSWVSPEKIKAWLDGRNRMVAYVLAVLLGAITPFCSCSSIPLFIGFLSAGIPLGVTLAFLITSPMVNEVAAVLFGEAIGWNFTLVYTLSGMAVGMVGGILADVLKLDRWVEKDILSSSASKRGCCCTSSSQETRILTWKDRLAYAWQETGVIVGRIWLYVVLGVAVGAGIHGYVPQDWVVSHVGVDNLLAVPLAVVLAVPLYANVTGLIPIAEVFIDKGVPVGTTLAFIMATAAISLPELLMLRQVIKPQLLAIFVGFLVGAFIVVGYSFNWLF